VRRRTNARRSASHAVGDGARWATTAAVTQPVVPHEGPPRSGKTRMVSKSPRSREPGARQRIADVIVHGSAINSVNYICNVAVSRPPGHAHTEVPCTLRYGEDQSTMTERVQLVFINGS